MGLFKFGKPKAPQPATAEMLPTDESTLYHLSNDYHNAGDYASAALCCEKLLTMPPEIPDKYRAKTYYHDAANRLVELYERGEVTPQNLEKARTIHSVHVKCVFARMCILFEDKVFKVFCSPLFCAGPEDHARIFHAAAEGVVWFRDYDRTKRNGQISTDSLTSFELLRGLIHLSESGMKHAVGKEAVLAFLASPKEPMDLFWQGWPNDWRYMTAEQMRPLVTTDNWLEIWQYNRAILKSLDKNLNSTQKAIKEAEIWKKEFPDAPNYNEQVKRLLEQFEEKYGSMTAQELLDSLYADEAAWQEAHSAAARATAKAEEAARLDEERRIARRENLYRNGLLLCAVSDEEKIGLDAMHEAAELGSERAVIWFLKRAAYRGNAEAFCMLGDLSMHGEYGLVQDELAAYGYYLAAAGASGRASAMLADFHRKGLAGVEVDEKLAEAFFESSVELGYGPSCLERAEQCMERRELTQAGELYARALKAENGDIVMAATAGLADLYRRKKDPDKAMEYAIRFAELDYALEPDDKDWERNRAGVLDRKPAALEQMWRVYCLYHNSGPAARHTGRITMNYRNRIGEVFSDAYLAALQPLDKAGDLEAATLLALHYINIGDMLLAYSYARTPMEKEYPKMLHYALLYPEEMKLTAEKMNHFRKVLAASGTKFAENAQLELQLEAHEKAEQQKHARMVREYQESQRQSAINEKVDALRNRMDLIERSFDLVHTGEGHTVEERAILGDVSAMDRVKHQMVRDATEERLRKKLDE